MLAKFSGVESERTVSKFRKEKENFCVVLTNSIKWARKIRKFHVSVVQRQLQKSVMHVQSCSFATIQCIPIINLFLSFSLPWQSSLQRELPIVVIQKICYRGNVTSHFSSLLDILYCICHIKKASTMWYEKEKWLKNGNKKFKYFCLLDWLSVILQRTDWR